MATYSKLPLSGSTHGRGILIAPTTNGTAATVHTAEATTTDGLGDNVTIEVANGHTGAVDLNLLWGGTTEPDDLIALTIPAKAGLVLVTAALFLRNALVVKAYASVASKLSLFGYVDRIT
jgi:hypothetical protein